MFAGCDRVASKPRVVMSSSLRFRRIERASRAVNGAVQYSRSASLSHWKSSGHSIAMPSGVRMYDGRATLQ